MKPYVPKELPLKKEDIDLLYFNNELIEANVNVAKYQILLENSKISMDLLINPLLFKEALQSTKIEGTQVTYDEVIESELNNKENRSDIKEVLNYYEAIKYGENILSTLPLSTRVFKELHRILLKDDVRGSNRLPGDYRTIQNYIGSVGCTVENASFVPPEPQLVNGYMSNLEKYINEPDDDLNYLLRIAIIHGQFETIHPFLDGNGRIGRILIPLYLYDKKVINSPNFFISDTLEKDKYKYYKLLNDIRFKENWNEWIKFFLLSINQQAKKDYNLIKEINMLYEKDLKSSMRLINNINIVKLVDVMFKHPIFNVKIMGKLTGISDATSRRYLSILEEENIIFSNGKARDKKYYYYSLLNLLR